VPRFLDRTATPQAVSTIVLQWLSRAKSQHFMAKKQADAKLPASFEEAMTELKQLVTRMEAGELPLDASVAAYQRGAELVKFCAAQLAKVEEQVKVLEDEMLKPFTEGKVEE
jgi:exodeoxyribonuclease VII small subunit